MAAVDVRVPRGRRAPRGHASAATAPRDVYAPILSHVGRTAWTHEAAAIVDGNDHDVIPRVRRGTDVFGLALGGQLWGGN